MFVFFIRKFRMAFRFCKFHFVSFSITWYKLKSIRIPPMTIITKGKYYFQVLLIPILFLDEYIYTEGIKNKTKDPNIPPVKLKTYWILSSNKTLTAKINNNNNPVNVIVCFDTCIGSTWGIITFRIFVRITMIYTENAATLRKT